MLNKKVLLREHERHTARRVASTLSVVLFQGGTPSLARGVPDPRLGGVPHFWLGVPHPKLGILWNGEGVSPGCGQTPVKTVPSRLTTYAGGKYCFQEFRTSEIPKDMFQLRLG